MSVKDVIPGYNAIVLPYHLVQTELSGLKYRHPAKKLRVIGVTGTNGKTTTCFMIWKMLNEAGRKAGLITTVAWGGVGGNETESSSLSNRVEGETLHRTIEHMTTPKVNVLNKRISAIRRAGAEFLVLEVTSHALAQYRTLNIPIEIAIMTNVTHEHLDYHKTFDRYLKAKTKLFKNADFGVINLDDPSWKAFKSAVSKDGDPRKYTTYSIDNLGDLQAVKIKLDPDGVKYKARSEGNPTIEIKTKIPGKFNVYNSLAAVAVGRKLGLTDDQIKDGLYALDEVEGRMNRVNRGQPFDVIVDFAHTPDAFQKVFDSVKDHDGRIISLFGGAGRRDESTRSERGEIAGRYSDLCIITEDDSRDEDPEKIAKQFEAGCKKAGLKNDQIIIELDREKAIKLALEKAEKGDLVLILGKGHEKTILRADGPHAFEDLKVTEQSLEKLLK
ncbi:UDP-N-acetylmuramoyl-L-alanyl-D-glutamate--2,6-diaminopimelate ligase [Candidatus Saccharibacteria bacterium]|nr:UDP-N-acetylmuramoyl-L-alanyl-D-glutamate--2,6-diaminopimelate ligase [Candidatus Saccharibacteria bacterium]